MQISKVKTNTICVGKSKTPRMQKVFSAAADGVVVESVRIN